MQFDEERTLPDPSRWEASASWPSHLFTGRGLFNGFVTMVQTSGYFRLYFATDDGFEPVGDYFRLADLEDAVLHLLSSLADSPERTPAR